MAASRKQYELLFQLKATYGNNFVQTFSSAAKTMKDMQGSISKINSLQKDISGYKKQQEALDKNNTKMQQLQEEYDRLQKEMSETAEPSEKLRKALERNERQMMKTIQAIDSEAQSLAELQERLRAAGVNTDNLDASTERLQRQYERLQQSQERIGDLSNRIERNNQAISQTKGQLMGVIGAATALGAAFYAGPITKAAEFEQQMSKVKAISGATAEELAELSSKAKQMGATTEFTAAQAGEAMEYMAMAGWKNADMLNGIEGIMYLASASGEDLASTSDIVTDALTAFGLSASDAGHFSDVLAQASSNANTNVGMMGSTFQKVAPVAGALGYSVEDMSLGIGLMANASIKAEVAGTSLKTALANMASPTDKQAAAMQKYGISLTRADGTMKSFGEVVENLRGSLGDLNETEQVAAATTIFGKESFAGMLAIVNATEEDFNKLHDAVYNCDGAAKQMSETMLDNFNGQMTLARSALDALQVSLGEALLPTFTAAVKKITEVVSKVAEFAEKNPELVRTIAKVTAGLLALTAGGLVAKLGFQEIHGGILKVQDVLEIFKGNTIKAGFSAMGLGAKLAGMGSSVVGYFGSLGGAFSNVIGSSRILSKVTGVARLIGGKLSGGVLGVLGKVTGKVTGIFGKIGMAVISGPLGKLGGAVSGIVGKIGTALAPVGNLFKTAFSPLAKLGGSLFGSFGGVVGKIFPIVAAITAVVTVIQLVRKNLDKIRDLVGKVFGEQGLVIFDKIVAVISSIGETIKNVFSDGNLGAARDKIQEIFGDKGVAVFDGFVSSIRVVQGIISQFAGFVTQHIVPVAEQIFSVIATKVIPGIMDTVQAAAPTIISIIQTVVAFIGQTATVIGGFIAGIMPVISEVISFLQANVFPVIGAVFDLIVSTVLPAIASGIQTAAETIMSIMGALLPFIQTAVTNIWAVVQPILQAALSFIQFMMPAIQAIVSTVIGTISGVINGLMTVLQGIIQFVTGVFTGNWSQAWEGVKNIFGGIFDSLKSIVKGVVNGIISVLNAAIRGLNKLKIPDWVPGIGGKGINIPEIPQFAKGTERTPDTFIAGENGPELITGAANRKVFTAMQTQNIFNNAMRQGGVADPGTPTAQGLKVGGGMIQIHITNSPQIQAAGGDAKEIESLLRQANEEFLTKVKALVKQALAEAEEQKARVAYA
ncbi:MAG: phage tail tape measure protein [Lachnospiraceae bacterium]|nr:phage tail tape measure protein [Lachnospiraceae bacterium]MCM1240440.1 phage tail tape measure protein [Lachnospiraceae bacterium]